MATILVVDDEKEMRKYLQDLLENAGYEVITAKNGSVAIQLYKQNPADLVITDLLMPEKDGAETIIELRSGYPDVKIIIITGGGNNLKGEDHLELIESLNVNYSFTKPVDSNRLLFVINKLLINHC